MLPIILFPTIYNLAVCSLDTLNPSEQFSICSTTCLANFFFIIKSFAKWKQNGYIFYDNVTNDTIVVYFYRYVYTTHVKMASILNYLYIA
jgi:hypothetical protein